MCVSAIVKDIGNEDIDGFYVKKMTTDLDPLWSANIFLDSVGVYAFDIAEIPSGRFAVTGSINEAHEKHFNMVLLDSTAATSIKDFFVDRKEISLFPNPVRETKQSNIENYSNNQTLRTIRTIEH